MLMVAKFFRTMISDNHCDTLCKVCTTMVVIGILTTLLSAKKLGLKKVEI